MQKRMRSLSAGLIGIVTLGLILTFIVIPAINRSNDDWTSNLTDASASGPDEGIKVHGSWIIDVKNPDGTSAQHLEFENALDPEFGAQTVAKLLARQVTPGGWTIALSSSPSSGILPWSGTGFIVEATYPGTESNRFKTLTVNVPTSGANRNKLVLSGSAIAQREGNIGMVGTLIDALSAAETRSGLYTMWDTGFTSTTLSSPVALTDGQTIAVTVIIGFS